MKGRYRYTILGLLFLATTINYIDRQIIGLLKPMLEKELHWTEHDYTNIVFSTIADQFPKKVVSSVSGIGGFGGAVGGMIAAQAVGLLLDAYKESNNLHTAYNLIFVLCGLSYVVAISLFHWLSPKLKRIEI